MKTQFQRLSRMVSTLQGVGGRKHAKAWTPCAAAPRSRGVALVITLILLSVITFMTVTFLVISRREGEQVDTTTQQNVAKFAAEGILQQAESQIISGIMGTRNGYNFGLVVSTNYVSPFYDTGGVLNALTNVNYTDINGVALTGNNFLQMLNNQLYLPRAPVFISTNSTVPPEFRFYLDENGNGMFDTNGLVTNQDNTGQYIPNGSGGFVTSVQVGDPEWIGFLEHPDQRHSSSNFFLSRGAFIAVPIGNSLDINYIHNQAKFLPNPSLATTYEGFLRNEGVGSWEINLAAFLHTLNTSWDSNGIAYSYNPNTGPSAVASLGTTFSDAAAIMQYRYSGNYNNLNSFQHLYGLSAVNFFASDFVDGYTVGPLMTGVGLPLVDLDVNYHKSPWSGADNPIQLIRPRDLLTAIPALIPSLPQNSFTNHLYSVGTSLDTYYRYTFYRMLAQMGMGSAPEPAPYPVGGSVVNIGPVQFGQAPLNPIPGRNQMSFGTTNEPYPYVHGRKMNLNYNNIGSNGVALTATNFTPWTPAEFFTNAADRLLRTYYPTNFALLVNGAPIVTNLNINFIPIYPVNYYTPAVHRLLQLAANMYDASTNKNIGVYPNNIDYPSVFKPYFAAIGSGATRVIYIAGYGEQPAPITTDPFWNVPLDLRRTTTDFTRLVKDINASANGIDTNDNVYGIPYVIGARTNLPNFNQFSMSSVVNLYRTLNVYRTSSGSSNIYTNVSYVIGISNVVGVQCWNSYTNYISRPAGIRILGSVDYTLQYSNTYIGAITPQPSNQIFGLQQSYILPIATTLNPWTNGVNGITGNYNIPTSFAVPIAGSFVGLPNGSYLMQNGSYTTTPTFLTLSANYTRNHSYIPDWGINVTNRLRLIMLDNASGRILDCVQLGGLGQLAGLDAQDSVLSNLLNSPMSNYWDPTPVSGSNLLARGISQQMAVAESLPQALAIYPQWINATPSQSYNSIVQAVSALNDFLMSNSIVGPVKVGYSVPGTFAKTYTWSANDPLVHYTVGDLTDATKSGANSYLNQANTAITSNTVILSNLYIKTSPRYMPWNTTNTYYPLITTNNQLAYRDPMINKSSDWQFLTNKYPNVGWLGRVHRGTPWQTVYLKSTAGFNLSEWQSWTGNPDPVDATNMMPQNDWQLLDLFTTAPNDNASRGQLSINQTNAAAWAAVLDGVMVLANNITPGVLVPLPLDTTTNGGPGQSIISAINLQQTNGAFTSLGQFLTVPQLTTGSPYITSTATNYIDTNLTDAVYERIPQQIMGLLRVGTPRYAIYAYGQSLKPAANSIVQSGQFFGMCTNYQITGEVLTRSIVRFDNMPVPGYPAPGQSYGYALPLQNATTPEFIWVTNTMPPMHTVVESYQVLSPDQ